MKTTLFPIAILFTLAACGDGGQPATAGAGGSAPAVDARAAAAFPEATAAGAFADSLAALPLATAGDKAAGEHYAKAVAGWYGSGLTPGIKAHPLAEGTWRNYRAVLCMVAKSRGLKKTKPTDAKNWDGLARDCEQVAATLVLLTQDKPAPTSDKALPQLQLVWDGMQHVRLGAERYMMYLEHPETRKNQSYSLLTFYSPEVI